MVASYASSLPAKYLKVGHHGSATSSGATFLSKVGMTDAYLSYGKNSYGHPAAETLDRLRAAGATIHNPGGSFTTTGN